MFTNTYVPLSVNATWLQIIYLFYYCGFRGHTDDEITPFQFLRLNKGFQMLLNPKVTISFTPNLIYTVSRYSDITLL
jgi:hypothetical protein